MLSLGWRSDGVADDVRVALRALASHYPLRENARGDCAVEFKKIAAPHRVCRIHPAGTTVLIEYSDIAAALRGAGRLLSESSRPRRTIIEETNFKTAGIMLDCSRNAVITVEHFKGWLRKMSLLGFTMAMLYTEDTYELPGEPFFGFQRGRYTADELREIDAYAGSLGIEMIGCIQTLAHLEQILKWGAYAHIKDTPRTLLIGDEKTYELIEKMISHFARHYRSRRIHIGMDEAEHFGRGRYMDINGYRPSFELFNEHLRRVVGLCEKYGLAPMLWSDMYFRMGSKTGDYYDRDCRIPQSVKKEIPKDVQLVYWDYYHADEAFYLDWIRRHRALGSEPVMASGIWTWSAFWYEKNLTEQNAGACVRAGKQAGLNEIFFTLWGDDGAYCDFDSALAGMAYVGELMYNDTVSPAGVKRRFEAVCGGDYATACIGSDLNVIEYPEVADIRHTNGALLWDDPLLAIYYRGKVAHEPLFGQKTRERYRRVITKLKQRNTDDQNRYALTLAQVLYQKIDVHIKFEKAYKNRDTAALHNVRRKIAALIVSLEEFDTAFCRQWLRRNKPQGLEVMQIRIAGLARRYKELRRRLGELAAGKIASIAECEESPANFFASDARWYRNAATGSAIL